MADIQPVYNVTRDESYWIVTRDGKPIAKCYVNTDAKKIVAALRAATAHTQEGR